MFKEYSFFLLLFVFSLFRAQSYTSAPPTWLASPYFRAGNQLMISSSTGNSSKPSFVFTFSSALPGIPNLAYGLKNYRAVDTMKSLNFEIRRENLTASTFGVSVQSTNLSNIFNLAVAYLAVDPLFPHHLNSFDNVPLNYSSGSLTNLSTLSLSATTHTETINYPQQAAAYQFKTFGVNLLSNKIVLFLTSLTATCFGKEAFQFSIGYSILNTTHYQLNARVFYNMSVRKVHFSQIIYNQEDVTSSKVYAIVNQYWDVLNAGGFISFPQMLTDNMILAITDFQAGLGECGFEYNWDFMSNYNNLSYAILITASLPSTKAPYKSQATCGLSSMRSTLFYIKTWKCVSPHSYFNLTTNLCQDACASYYFGNLILGSCDTCHYTCLNCSAANLSTACTNCETGLNRVMSSNSCICVLGYFDDWHSPTCRECSAVDSNCLTCTYTYDASKTTSDYQSIFASSSWPITVLSDYKCTLCKPSYFVNSSYLCQSCPLSYCTLCASLTACQTCDSSLNATKYTDNLCYLCNVANCAICSSNNVCAQCAAGYVLLAGLCQSCEQACNCGGWVLPIVNGSCSTLCGDGYKLGAQQCDDSNTNDHDGCSSTCITEDCNLSCACDGWVQPWVNGSCSTFCGDNFNRGAEECDDGNTNNNDGCSSTCLNEGCNVSCLCDGWSLPYTNGTCGSVCGDNLLRGAQQCDDGNKKDHDGCSSICETQPCKIGCSCDGWTLPWLTWPSESCSTICGDGLLRGAQQCDDGNTNDHDGCSSTCMAELCNISCLCDGWSPPFVNGSCLTICGDGILLSPQQCDDGNTNDHDGCSSNCTVETCDLNCSCNGWTLPWVNGSCTGIYGDGLIRGSQVCDDGNTDDSDSCHNNCKIWVPVVQQDPVLLSSSMSMLLALGLFILGFRIVGLQALNVFQSFQLLLFSQGIESFILSFNLHGYSDPTYFSFQIQSENHIFGHFNFMYLILITLFVIGATLEIYNKSCRSKNKVNNEFDPNKQFDEKNDPKETQIRSVDQQTDDFGDFTVHYKVNEQINKSNSHMALSQISNNTQNTESPFWGSILFRQVFFDLAVNCQQVFAFALVQQICQGSSGSFLNFPTFATILSMLFVIAVILAVCTLESEGFGQNHMKFHKNKAIVYWTLMLSEKIVFSAILGVKISWGIYLIMGLKTVLLAYYIFADLYFERIQKVRSVLTHSLHLMLILTFVINELTFKPQNILVPISRFFIQYVYSSLLGCVMLICLGFYVREFMKKCAADFRNQDGIECPIIVNPTIRAIFDFKQDQSVQKSYHQFNLPSLKGQNIFDELKTKQLLPRSSTHLQIPSQGLQKDAGNRKLDSVNHINSSIVSHRDSIGSIKTKHSFKNHRRSHLSYRKMNVFQNEVGQEKSEINQETILKLKNNNKENLKTIYENENINKTSIEEETEGKYNISDSVFKEKNDMQVKTQRRFGLKSKKKSEDQWTANIWKTDAYEVQQTYGKHLQNFSMTGEVFRKPEKISNFLQTFSSGKKRYKLRKPMKKEQRQNKLLKVQSFEHAQIHNQMNMNGDVSISFS